MALRVRNRGVNKHSSMPPFFGGATLDMNFAAGLYFGATPSSLTVTRAAPATTYAETSGGVLVPFAANVARITDKGLLVEEARTNVCLQSQTLGTTWTTAAASVTADQTTAPDGTTTADLVTEDGTNAAHGVSQTITAASNVAYAGSVYVKPNGRTWIRLFLDDGGGTNLCQGYFNCSGTGTVGTVANGGTGSGAAGTIQALANGWYRCVLTGTPSSVNTASIRFLLRVTTADNTSSHAGNSTSGAYFWGAQVEAGTWVTSYIPTTTGSQARSVDSVRLTSTAFSSWYTGGTSGTVYASALMYVPPSSSSSFPVVLSVDDNTSTNRIQMRRSDGSGTPTGSFVMVNAGATQANTVSAAIATSDTRLAYAYATNDVNGAANGLLGTLDTASSTPTVTQLFIGSGPSTTTITGYVRRVAYFPSRLADATLQMLTV